MPNRKHIDQFINDKIRDYTPVYDEKNWDKMVGMLAQSNIGSKRYRKLFATAIAISIIAGTFLLVKHCRINQGQNISEVNPVEKKMETQIKQELNPAIEKPDLQPKQPTVIKEIFESDNDPDYSKPNNYLNEDKQNKPFGVKHNSNDEIIPDLQFPAHDINNQTPEPATATVENTESGYPLVNFQSNDKIDTGNAKISDPETIPDNSNPVKENNIKNNRKKFNIDPNWEIGIYVGSDYYLPDAKKSEEGFDIIDKSSFQLSPGIQISRKLGRLYHLSTGLFYISKTYRVNYNGIANPAYSEIPQFSDFDLSFIEIPVSGSYDYLISDFLSLYLSAGFVNQILVSDFIKTTYTSPATTVNPFENVPTYKVSMMINTGLKYSLGQTLELDLQPTLRISLKNSLVAGSSAKHDLIGLRKIFPGAYIGIKYKF